MSKVFERSLASRYETFKNALDNALRGFSGDGDLAHKKTVVQQLQQCAENLLALLDHKDQPPWLKQIQSACAAYSKSSNIVTGEALLRVFVNNIIHVAPIVIVADSGRDFSFDNVFERLRADHKITEIFDRLITELTKIVEAGEIDSATVLAALNDLISAVRANRKGSYYSVAFTLNYSRLMWNFVKEYLKKIPVLGESMAATERTIKEGEEANAKIQAAINQEALAVILSHIPNIQKLTQFIEQQHGPRITGPVADEVGGVDGEIQDAEFEAKPDGE